MEVKSLGKRKASPVSCEWCEWESKLDFDTAEWCKGSRKKQRCKHAAPELPAIGCTKFGEEGPNMPLLTGIVEPMPTGSMLPLWGKGDLTASIIGKLPHPLGKSKPGQRSWQISDLEFQKALQVARAVCPTDRMGKQHAIISHMMKHKKQQCHANPPHSQY